MGVGVLRCFRQSATSGDGEGKGTAVLTVTWNLWKGHLAVLAETGPKGGQGRSACIWMHVQTSACADTWDKCLQRQGRRAARAGACADTVNVLQNPVLDTEAGPT
jgi:hypothetical protein